MKSQHVELWHAIEARPIGPRDAAETYLGRIADQCSRSRAEAENVLGESRRFLYLQATADHAAVAPAAVDRAWCLHLLDTRSYAS